MFKLVAFILRDTPLESGCARRRTSRAVVLLSRKSQSANTETPILLFSSAL
uniref:Uncharacterized protein n=1 Tax=Ascaris lumbricoides TaxID=6252 RepID=A0A0M3HUC9_ASCLU